MIDPLTGAAIGAGINFLGGLFGGGSQEDMARMDAATRERIAQMQTREGQRQYNISQFGNVLQQLEQLPMRDRISYLVSQRLGMAPSAFQPRDIYNPGTSATTPQMGGLDLAQYQRAASAYQPGMGGTGQVADAYRTMGTDLGYGNLPVNFVDLGPGSRGSAPPSGNYMPLTQVNAGMSLPGSGQPGFLGRGAGGGGIPIAAMTGVGGGMGRDRLFRYAYGAQPPGPQAPPPPSVPYRTQWGIPNDPTKPWGG